MIVCVVLAKRECEILLTRSTLNKIGLRGENISDDQTEFCINDRFSFMEFLNLRIGQRIPDAKTIWHLKNIPTPFSGKRWRSQRLPEKGKMWVKPSSIKMSPPWG